MTDTDVRIKVYKTGDYWMVRESWKRNPSVQTNTWPQAMKQADKYKKLLTRRARRKGL